MPWNGSGVFTQTNGVYTGATIWNSDKNAGTLITSAHHDTHDYDMAQGINNCLAKDGQNTLTILNLSGTVNSTSGIIKVGTYNALVVDGANGNIFSGDSGNFTLSGSANSGFGLGGTLGSLTTGINNSAFGGATLQNCTTGRNNTAVGELALNSVTTGSNNVGIGRDVDVPSATSDGQLSLQNALYGTGNTGTSTIPSTGNLGAYVQAPTARFHLPAGSATAGTAPLKMTSGTVLGTPEDGAIEFDGTHLYVTIGGVRKTVTVT